MKKFFFSSIICMFTLLHSHVPHHIFLSLFLFLFHFGGKLKYLQWTKVNHICEVCKWWWTVNGKVEYYITGSLYVDEDWKRCFESLRFQFCVLFTPNLISSINIHNWRATETNIKALNRYRLWEYTWEKKSVCKRKKKKLVKL